MRSSISHSLSANMEDLVLTGTSAITATGNSLDNLLTGNALTLTAAQLLAGAAEG